MSKKLTKTPIKIYPCERLKGYWFFKQIVYCGDRRYIFDRIVDSKEKALNFPNTEFYKNKCRSLQNDTN